MFSARTLISFLALAGLAVATEPIAERDALEAVSPASSLNLGANAFAPGACIRCSQYPRYCCPSGQRCGKKAGTVVCIRPCGRKGDHQCPGGKACCPRGKQCGAHNICH